MIFINRAYGCKCIGDDITEADDFQWVCFINEAEGRNFDPLLTIHSFFLFDPYSALKFDELRNYTIQVSGILCQQGAPNRALCAPGIEE